MTVHLEPFTVFVGANGSGKTSFLQALELLCRTFQTQQSPMEEFQQNRSFAATDEVELSCQSGETFFRYRTSINQQMNQHGRNWAGEGPAFAKLEPSLDWKPWQPKHGQLPHPIRLRLDPNILRSSSNGNDIRAMGNNGQGMHRALSSMMLKRRKISSS